MDIGNLFFSMNGRINRAKWWLGVLILTVVSLVLYFVAIAVSGVSITALDDPSAYRRASIVSLVLGILLLWPAVALTAKRLQDRNRPGAIAWLVAVFSLMPPLLVIAGLGGTAAAPSTLSLGVSLLSAAVGLWWLIDLGILRGTLGTNAYGPDPLAGKLGQA